MIQNADIIFFGVLIAVSAAMWFARSFMLVIGKFLPIAIAALGTLATAFFLYFGQSIHWRTPDSPGLLLIFLFLFISIVVAAGGWLFFAFQVRHGRFKSLQPKKNDTYKVVIAIVVLWCLVGSAYEFYRTHVSSHGANVIALSFSNQSRFLFSLDRNGHLKKWNLRTRSQAAEWQINSGPVAKLFAREDASSVFVLSSGQFTEYSLNDRIASPIQHGAYLDAAELGAGEVALLTGSELQIFNPETEQTKFKFSLPNAKVLTSVTPGALIILTADQSRRIYEIKADDLRFKQSPDWLEQKALEVTASNINPTFATLVTVWSDILVQSSTPNLQGFRAPENLPFPLFNHSRTIGALLASHESGGPLAFGIGPEVYIKYEPRYDPKDELWLVGNIQLPDLF